MNNNLVPDDVSKVGFYIIHNVETDDCYVGSGVLGRRLSAHNSKLKNNKHWNSKLQEAYNQNPNFEFIGVPVDTGNFDEDRKLALEIEASIVSEIMEHPRLLNLALQGIATREEYKHGPKVKEKMREISLNLWQDPNHREKVIAAQNAGRAAMTEEEIIERNAKLSSSLKDAYANGVRQSNAGQVRSEEFCQANSSKITDKWQDPEYRERQRQARIQGGNMVRSGKEVVVGDITYSSQTEAGVAHGITKQSVSSRIKSDSYPDWNYRVGN